MFKKANNDRRYFKRRAADRKSPLLQWGTRFFALIGLSLTISLVLISISLSNLSGIQKKATPLPDNIVLFHQFDHAVLESHAEPSFTTGFLDTPPSVHDLIKALDKASKDPRVAGFIARLQGSPIGLAHIQELEAAIDRFHDSGRFTYIYSEDFGGMGSGMTAYRFASMFQTLWLQPVGIVSISGLAAETPFFREILDKIGVNPQIGRRGPYKSTPESALEKDMSPQHRQMMEWVITDLFEQMITSIAENRNIDKDKLKSLVDQSPLSAEDAKAAGLIDKVDYLDRLVEEAKERAGKGAETISLMDYYARTGASGQHGLGAELAHKVDRDKNHTPEIALIYGDGAVMPGDDQAATEFYAFIGGKVMSSRQMVRAFEMAIQNDDVKAIVFRVNSPGGSPSASESILRMVERAKEKGKPVIVSMGPMAASGGYWISALGTKIVADPGTITGSIGVFAGKMDLSALYDKLGVHWAMIARGQNSDMWSHTQPFTPEQQAVLDRMLDRIYDQFLERVAKGRNMTKQDVDKIAQGRVWTGKQAQEIGLVDALGGLDTAIDLARATVGLDKDGAWKVEQYPPPPTPLEQFMKLMRNGFAMSGAPVVGQKILQETLAPLAPYMMDPMDAATLAPVQHVR